MADTRLAQRARGQDPQTRAGRGRNPLLSPAMRPPRTLAAGTVSPRLSVAHRSVHDHARRLLTLETPPKICPQLSCSIRYTTRKENGNDCSPADASPIRRLRIPSATPRPKINRRRAARHSPRDGYRRVTAQVPHNGGQVNHTRARRANRPCRLRGGRAEEDPSPTGHHPIRIGSCCVSLPDSRAGREGPEFSAFRRRVKTGCAILSKRRRRSCRRSCPG